MPDARSIPVPCDAIAPSASGIGAGARHGISRAAAVADLIRDFALAHPERAHDIAAIATVTGLRPGAIRRLVMIGAGEPLRRFVTHVRLDQAHRWLSSTGESRSQSEIATALGFSTSAIFGRSYRRRFGESAGNTRRRAVKISDDLARKI